MFHGFLKNIKQHNCFQYDKNDGVLLVHKCTFRNMKHKMCFNVTIDEDCMIFE